jgi:hypothetical protein
MESAIIATEREAIGVQAEFLAAVPNLDQDVKDRLIDFIVNQTDADLLERFFLREDE